ncbi:MAG: hypothetical protein OXF75_03925, partial [Acidimicrobiaceae bacterium]|nr:hypothetical protein [Acidimicrobiaceae bacterium]
MLRRPAVLRLFVWVLATALLGSLLAVAPAVVAPSTAPAAEAQTADESASYPLPWLHRREIVEGQSREFLINNVPSGHSGYWLRVKPLVSPYTAEAGDFTVWDRAGPSAGQQSDANVIVEPGSSEQVSLQGATRPRRRPGQPRPPAPTHGYVNFEAQAIADSIAEAGGETFGVQLCTSSGCT